MKSFEEIKGLLNSCQKDKEEALGLKIRNGQASGAIKATLNWVLDTEIQDSQILQELVNCNLVSQEDVDNIREDLL